MTDTPKLYSDGTYMNLEFPLAIGDMPLRVHLSFSGWPKKQEGNLAAQLAALAVPLLQREVPRDTNVRGAITPHIPRLTECLRASFQEQPASFGWTLSTLELRNVPTSGEHMAHLELRRKLSA